jgi:glucose/arabinose dehydrogenase
MHLHRILFDSSGTGVANEEKLFQDRYGRLRDVVNGPEGALYISTSNRDGRGSPIQTDDRILKVVPGQ